MKLCIDMDGVIANFTERAIMMTDRVYKLKLTCDDLRETRIGNLIRNRLLDRTYNEQVGFTGIVANLHSMVDEEKEIYKKICPKGFFASLSPYPNAIEAVKSLDNAGHEIIFLTKPLEWKHSSSEKIEWLNEYFNDIRYSVIMVSDMSSKHMIQCDCLIDDDPRALVKLPPYHGICIARPWNKEFREKSYEGIVANSMAEAAEWLLANEDFMSLSDKGGFDAPKSY